MTQLTLCFSDKLMNDLDKIEKIIARLREKSLTQNDDYAYFDMARIYETAANVCDRSNAKSRWPVGATLVEEAHDDLIDAIEFAHVEADVHLKQYASAIITDDEWAKRQGPGGRE